MSRPFAGVIGAIAILTTLLIALAYLLAPRPGISTSVFIAAPPSRVWAVLMDTADYPSWTPDRRLIGSLVPGSTIEHIEGQGEDQMIFWPKILVVQPDRELRWLGHYKFPGLFDAEHDFLLQPEHAGTRFQQSETFRGIALWFYDARQLLSGFDRFNDALKRRAERP